VLGFAWQQWSHAQRATRHKLAGWIYPGITDPPVDEVILLTQRIHEAVFRYKPRPYDSPIVLFRSRVLQTGRLHDPELGWAEVAEGGLTVVETPGEHGEMFLEPTVALLSHKLQQYLPGGTPDEASFRASLEPRAVAQAARLSRGQR
jgi:hypothetical protein